jgi:hypothetical protein
VPFTTQNVPFLNPPEQFWECPNCDLTDVTNIICGAGEVPSRFHNCKGLRGISAPMVPAGTACKVEQVDREDYVGGEVVQTDGEGRPLMSVVTTRDDGTDCTVYAPCATASSEME